MKCSLRTLLKQLAAENQTKHENQKEYDHLLHIIHDHYLHILSELPKGKVLDIGSAYGTQSAAFASLGHIVTALDPMPEYCDPVWLKKHKVTFLEGNIETDEIEGEYDYLVVSEVIEHFNYSPVPAVEKMYKLLKPDGLIFVSTPKKESAMHRQAATGRYVNYLHYRDIPEAWNGYDFVDAHHYLYMEYELVQLFHEVGFKVKDIYPINLGTHHFLVAQK